MSEGTGADGSGLHFTLPLPGVDDIAVIDFTHREALSQPFELVLNLASRDGSLDAAELLDRDASLAIFQKVDPLTIINTLCEERGFRDVAFAVIPGLLFSLTDQGTDSLNRDWQAISVTHHGEQLQALEEGGIALSKEAQSDSVEITRYHIQVMLIPGDTPWRHKTLCQWPQGLLCGRPRRRRDSLLNHRYVKEQPRLGV